MNNELIKKIETMEKELASLKSKALEDDADWNPIGGPWFLTYSGEIKEDANYSPEEVAFGLNCQTQGDAEELLPMVRSLARQFQWLKENDDGWRADWDDNDQAKHYVYFKRLTEKWEAGSFYFCQEPNKAYMSKANAQKLSELINSGKVVL
jgi:hypothetical protein